MKYILLFFSWNLTESRNTRLFNGFSVPSSVYLQGLPVMPCYYSDRGTNAFMCSPSLKRCFPRTYFGIWPLTQWKATGSVIRVLAAMVMPYILFTKYGIKIFQEIITDVTQYYLPSSKTTFCGSSASYPAFPALESRMIVDYSLVMNCCSPFLHMTPILSIDKSKIQIWRHTVEALWTDTVQCKRTSLRKTALIKSHLNSHANSAFIYFRKRPGKLNEGLQFWLFLCFRLPLPDTRYRTV